MGKGRSNGKRVGRDTAKGKGKLEISPLSLPGQHFRQTLRSSGLGLVVECFRRRPSFFRTPSGGHGSPHKPALRFSSLLGWLARLQNSTLDVTTFVTMTAYYATHHASTSSEPSRTTNVSLRGSRRNTSLLSTRTITRNLTIVTYWTPKARSYTNRLLARCNGLSRSADLICL